MTTYRHTETINALNKMDHKAIDQDVKAAQEKRKKDLVLSYKTVYIFKNL